MRYILFAAALFFTSISFSQNAIKLEDAAKHVGDSVTVCGKVANAIFLEDMENGPTFLNLGAAYPDQLLNLVIWKEQRGAYDPAPESQYADKNVCVTGKIVLMNNLPQIVIYNKEQITVTDK
ncbi:MAG: hypothetical protein ABIO55_18410 [Ginsengibacter sp.]